MAIYARCPKCDAEYHIVENALGKEVACRSCGHRWVLAHAAAQAGAAAPPPAAQAPSAQPPVSPPESPQTAAAKPPASGYAEAAADRLSALESLAQTAGAGRRRSITMGCPSCGKEIQMRLQPGNWRYGFRAKMLFLLGTLVTVPWAGLLLYSMSVSGFCLLPLNPGGIVTLAIVLLAPGLAFGLVAIRQPFVRQIRCISCGWAGKVSGRIGKPAKQSM